MNFDDNVDGYIKFSEIYKYFNISFHKLETLVKYYKLNDVKYKGMRYLKKEDFEFLKNLKDEIYEKYSGKLSKNRFKNKLTLTNLAKKFNVSANALKSMIKNHNIQLNCIIENNVKIYDENSITILTEFFKKPKYSKKSMAECLKINIRKLNKYLECIKPNQDEFDGVNYNQKFLNRLKQFIDKNPNIAQNKVYVNELQMQFDSKSEAYYYCYMKDHNHNITYHPLKLQFIDFKNKNKIYEVDFLVDENLVEIKGDNQFDKNGNPIYKGISWEEKYKCMLENNVEIIKSKRLERDGDLRFMKDYFYEHYSFKVLNKLSTTYMISLQNVLVNNYNLYKNVITSEMHFRFEWLSILGYNVAQNKYYKIVYGNERREYILSKIEELRIKGLDVSWFEENEEKYFPKIIDEKQKDITIFDM